VKGGMGPGGDGNGHPREKKELVARGRGAIPLGGGKKSATYTKGFSLQKERNARPPSKKIVFESSRW